MKLITFALMLSFLALASSGPADAQEITWDAFLQCAKVGSKAVATALRSSVPTARTFLTCIDYSPLPNPTGSYLRCLKNIIEFLKRSVLDKTDCLIQPLKSSVNLLMPYVHQLDQLKCFDQ